MISLSTRNRKNGDSEKLIANNASVITQLFKTRLKYFISQTIIKTINLLFITQLEESGNRTI